jgi:hypothetical protein
MKKMLLIATLCLVGLTCNSEAKIVSDTCQDACRKAADSYKNKHVDYLIQANTCQKCLLEHKEKNKTEEMKIIGHKFVPATTVYNGSCPVCDISCFRDTPKGPSCGLCVAQHCYPEIK